ncbi:helix-turn-helix domain-containing protein [Spirillospora albida]|uniref:helix-turn-helix domain-containing protein n=1 Tax=Spirillospora albida TaxID=58123 RepID=UPI001B805BFC|nr:helix-turn-helix domain-containing protein [Spirillospora albida]
MSTVQAPVKDRFDFWREVTSKTWVPLDVVCEPPLEGEFQAQVGIRDLGSVQMTLMTTTPHSVRRTPALIRRSDPEVLLLTCAVCGPGMMGEQDGRRTDCVVGDLSLYDSSRPYVAGLAPRSPVSRLLVLQFPRHLLPLPERALRRLTAVRIPGDHGVGALSSQFLLQLARRVGELTPSDGARVSSLALDVLTTALAGELDAQSTVPSHVRQRALTAQIQVFIRENLSDARLTPGAIAAAHHISVRYLHRLFQAEGHTVAGYVRELRLEQCRRDLADSRLSSRSVTEIAARWGFTNPSHFSQSFRSAFGIPPREFRRRSTHPG